MKFELVTPEKLYTSLDAVSHVMAPGEEGDFGVLAGHMPLISTLRSGGEVKVDLENGKAETFVVSGGFVEVTSGSVTVFAESVTE